MSAPEPGDSGKTTQPPAELRLAATFTGGVSLAVWMGGMAREINLLLAASRRRRGMRVADTTEQGQKVRDLYAKLLELLNVDCSMDVISGTSAGGINAVILGLANAQCLDLDGLRELWFDEGALSGLLRDPGDQQPTSLLYGDKALLQGLRTGLAKLVASARPDAATGTDPTRVFITTTLLSGMAGIFSDEYGTVVSDVDHHGLFSFTSAQLTPDNVPALALAARCSASFPVAFEPGFVSIGTSADDAHPDMAPFITGKVTSQFVADGGLLANRPIGPALQAIFDRRADREVRRVLAFVVPTLGGDQLRSLPDPPGLFAALGADVGAVMAQSISSDLAAITAHNQQVRARNDARQELAVMGASMERLGTLFYPRYRARRIDSIARAAADEVMERVPDGQLAPDGRPFGFGAAARDASTAAKSAADEALTPDLPEVGDYDAMNAVGRDALDEGRATVLAVLRPAFRLMPSAQRKRDLGALRARVADAMPAREPVGDTFTRAFGVGPEVPASPGVATLEARAANAAQALLDANMSPKSGDQPWRQLAEVVIDLRRLMAQPDASAPEVAGAGEDGPESPREFVWNLLDYLTGPTGTNSADLVASRLFDLQVARYAVQPDSVLYDQAVELIQMSSDTGTSLDTTRSSASQKLTGLKMHHFGAFYKASWRANDWMWGRLDGAGWLVHMLLDPPRLRQLASESGNPTSFRADLRAQLEEIAGAAAPPGIWEPLPANGNEPGKGAEMAFLTDVGVVLPPSLPTTATWVAAGLQRFIAGEELAHVVEQVNLDARSGANEQDARAFLDIYNAAVGNGCGPAVPAAKAADVLKACQIPAEGFNGEIGSRLFNGTVIRAAAVAGQMLYQAVPSPLRPLLAPARTVTSLAAKIDGLFQRFRQAQIERRDR